jgi:pantetheine-phosphate adenylyltransferase
MAERIIIYPGTFDPLTYGHVDIIRRGAALGDRLIVAVSVNIGKQPLFSIDERVALVQDEIDGLTAAGNLAHPVEVRSFDGLLTEFANQQGASAILRGLRAVADF